MKKQIAVYRTCIIIILLFVTGFVNGQPGIKAELVVSEHINSNPQTRLPYSATFRVQLDGGFKNDTVKIKTGRKSFVSGPLNSHELLGYAGTIKIPKKKVRQKIKIYLNNIYVGELELKKEYSEAHINYFEGKFNWMYINYRFGYL